MINSKKEFIRAFLPDNIEDISFSQINLDITDLSIADILRNVNDTFPIYSKTRCRIEGGSYAVSVLCKSETLDPIGGLMLIITNGDNNIEVYSKNYIVITIDEEKIKTEESIQKVTDNITKFLIRNFRDIFDDFNSFYVKYVYNEYEYEKEKEKEKVYDKYL